MTEKTKRDVKFILSKDKMEDVAKQIFYLAWQACGGTIGMGFLQDRPQSGIEDVWNNIINPGDYFGMRKPDNFSDLTKDNPITIFADYVFGRMMKLNVKFSIDEGHGYIEVHDGYERPDYQAWCAKYKKTSDLVEAAFKAADITEYGILETVKS